MQIPTDPARDMGLLEQIEHDPDVTQASLASLLGVAVGTVNWHLKRLIAKGYVKVKRAERKKLKYIITPEGIAFRANLTLDYIEQSMVLYRRTRMQVIAHLQEVKRLGYDRIAIEGDGDIADVCRLTCIEQGVHVVPGRDHNVSPDLVPTLASSGTKVTLRLPGQKTEEYSILGDGSSV